MKIWNLKIKNNKSNSFINKVIIYIMINVNDYKR